MAAPDTKTSEAGEAGGTMAAPDTKTGEAWPRLIINADDFGVSPGVNRAIIAAFQDGVLNSASLMINAAWTEEALALAAANPGLAVGLHLNLTGQMGQRALAPPAAIPLLAEADGRLKRGFMSLLALSLGAPRELRRQAETEMRAQIEAALARGLKPAHLDSHRHAHMIPLLFETAEKLKEAYGLARLRRVNESLLAAWRGGGLGGSLRRGGLIKFMVLRLCAACRPRDDETYFYSILYSTRLFGRRLERICIPRRYQAAELCFHPGLPETDGELGEPGLAAFQLFSPDRRREFEALMDRSLPERVFRVP